MTDEKIRIAIKKEFSSNLKKFSVFLNRKMKAFTLIEVTVVILIISIIAAFMVPNYAKAVAKADERNMIVNLMAMRVAVKMYTLDGATTGALNSLDEINSNLGISIIDPKATYTCPDVRKLESVCTAIHPRGWVIRFQEDSGGLLHCAVGTCPSCPAQPGNCG